MSPLLHNLLVRCRDTFLKCHEFSNYDTLHAVFIRPELSAFRFGLRRADNSSDLVDFFLEYIIELKLRGGYPVLPIFLTTLRDRYPPENELHNELDSLCTNVQNAMTGPEHQVSIPHREQQLFDLLLKLNFDEQVRIAKQVIRSRQIAAFLVHGDPGYGQQLLVNRLLRLSPGWENAKRISIDAGSKGIGKNSYALWRQIAAELKMPTSDLSSKLAEEVCQWLQTQDVIFIFHSIDYMPLTLLSDWMHEFWQRLVTAAKCSLRLSQRDTHLLLFLVDYSGCVCNRDFALARQPDQPDYPYIPLSLPPAGRFTPDALDSWIDEAAAVLPVGLTGRALLEASGNGVPQSVYDTICNQCGLNWEGELAKWLI